MSATYHEKDRQFRTMVAGLENIWSNRKGVVFFYSVVHPIGSSKAT